MTDAKNEADSGASLSNAGLGATDYPKPKWHKARELERENARLRDAAEWALQEIERLRRYADAMNGKHGTERHIYNGACPDNGQPDSRDPECPACQLLVPNA